MRYPVDNQEGLVVINLAIVSVLAGVCAVQPGAEHDGSGGKRETKSTGAAGGAGNPHGQAGSGAAGTPLDWKALEAPLLTEHVQLTSRDKFVKAGEAYFDHNSPPRWVVFQAVPVPEKGKEPDGFYGMYVAKLTYDGGKIAGIEEAERISPDRSANTCGWFHPTEAGLVIYGSTLKRPEAKERPGFQVGTNRYVWQFPPEMEIVQRSVVAVFDDEYNRRVKEYDEKYGPTPRTPPPWPTDTNATPVFARPNYDAECSYTKDGRFILYAHVRDEATRGKDDADIWVYDTKTGKQHEIVKADGYDGGPFFSPDGKRICYRSDREGNDKLQLFVADLKFDADGVPVGIEREHQVTANEHVNWAPFWHPSGRFLIYGTSAMGHSNYEVFAVEVPEARDGAKKAGELRSRRITSASGADVLPVFSDDGQWMMWTAQRGAMVEGESKPSSQVWVARTTGVFGDVGKLFDARSAAANVLNREQATKRITELLRASEAEGKAKMPAGGHYPDYDLSKLRVERVKGAWRGRVNPWNVPDGDKDVLVLDDGRTFVLSASRPPPQEIEEWVYAAVIPDP